MLKYKNTKINKHLAFSPFYFNGAKLNLLRINGCIFFFAKELARSLKFYSRTSRYLRKYINNCDIKRIKFRQYRDTPFNVFWQGFNFSPKLLLNIKGASVLVKHIDKTKLSSFKNAVRMQVFHQQTLKNCLYSTDEFHHVLIILKRHPQWRSRLRINLNCHNKNRDTFIHASTIAHQDYHCNLYQFNKLLEAFNVQYKVNGYGPYRLTEPNLNYAEVIDFKNHSSLVWHPEGRIFIRKIMSRHGIRCY